MFKKLSTAMAIAAMAATSSFAAYVDVTVHDGHVGSVNFGLEDQELETGEDQPFDQDYDLEAFLYNYENKNLGMIGGWNFDYLNGITTGDIFLDMGQNGTWDYAIKFDVNDEDYTIYGIDEGTITNNGLWTDGGVPRSYATPFLFEPDEDKDPTGVLSYETLSSTQTSYIGDTHYLVSDIDLSSIVGDDDIFSAFYTMSCGNDIMVAQVPEPAMLSFLGIGLIALAGFASKKKNN